MKSVRWVFGFVQSTALTGESPFIGMSTTRGAATNLPFVWCQDPWAARKNPRLEARKCVSAFRAARADEQIAVREGDDLASLPYGGDRSTAKPAATRSVVTATGAAPGFAALRAAPEQTESVFDSLLRESILNSLSSAGRVNQTGGSSRRRGGEGEPGFGSWIFQQFLRKNQGTFEGVLSCRRKPFSKSKVFAL